MESKILRNTQEYFELGRRDFFTPYLLKLAFLPLFFGFALLCGILYIFGGEWYVFLYESLRVDFGFSSAWLAWIQSLFDYVIKASVIVLFIFGVLAGSFLISLSVCAFVTPYVARYIRDLHYQECSIEGNANTFVVLLWLFGVYVCYALFLLALLPLYFIPFVGGFVMLIPSYWLFSKTMIADVGETIFKKEAFKELKKTQKGKVRSAVIPLFLINLIPIVGFFSPVYALSVLAHLFFDIKLKENYGNAHPN
ncbi:EI24 domain-containing protein [Helicobacter winghamensis]|uniref:EI24 domain-containing protein n=1 Tax=Helicobacter winghamensis TaxID=157268 RepID=UPI0018A49F44|nr:EI24 domain-containing protein [Helicobacter winghamensis]QOQ98235.1 EI24 domain-containing protein [Helicobacter winghamensis]